MSFLSSLSKLVQEPLPEIVFEVSEAGVAYARPGVAPQVSFVEVAPETVVPSPSKENVQRPEVLAEAIRPLTSPKGGKRRAVLILPDYCARVVVIDFDSFPATAPEQMALVRFRLKKSVPFDLESAAVSYQLQAGRNGKKQVVVAALSRDVLNQYEAPFRNAGFQTGMVTTSSLASVDLVKAEGVTISAKMTGRVLTVTVLDGARVQMVRCVELATGEPEEIMGVLYPTVAYAEDELQARPKSLLLCGFKELGQNFYPLWESELGVPVEMLRSRWGTPGEYNAGLLGYLESAAA